MLEDNASITDGELIHHCKYDRDPIVEQAMKIVSERQESGIRARLTDIEFRTLIGAVTLLVDESFDYLDKLFERCRLAKLQNTCGVETSVS